MNTSELTRFLAALDDALIELSDDEHPLELYLVGRAALILRYGLPLATKDLDITTRGPPSHSEELLLEAFGKGTPNALKLGLYLENLPDAVPPMPWHYRKRASEIPGEWKQIRPKLVDPNDQIISKLKRFHVGDREDIRILCDSGDVSIVELRAALESAFPFAMDEEEDPDFKRINSNLEQVIEYLEGRTPKL